MTRVEERMAELLQVAAPVLPGVALDAVRAEVHRRRTARSWLAASAMVVAVVVAVVTVSATAGDGRHVHVTTTPTPTIDLTGTVPWTGAPMPDYQPPTAPPPTPRATDARACTAGDVTAAYGDSNGAGGHLVIYVRFRNTSASTCVLKGYPRVTATQPGLPDVHGTDGSFFGAPGTANMRPGQETFLGVQTDTYCAARPGGGPVGPAYHHLDVTLPGGGTVTLDSSRVGFDVTCGLHLTPFYVPQPEPPAPHDPLGDLAVSLEVPDRVAAGSTLTYVADLTNPTDQAISLDRCPGYVEATTTPTIPVTETYALNCAPVGAIAAHNTVRFQMRLHVPAQTAAGPLTFQWALAGPLTVTAEATVTVTN